MSTRSYRPLTEPDGKRDEIELRMRSYAAIAFALAVDMEVQDIAGRAWPVLQDEVCGIAVYAETGHDTDAGLCSHAGFEQAPPDGATAHTFRDARLASLFEGGGADQVVCFGHGNAPEWLGPSCGCVVMLHFTPGTGNGMRGFVLFAIRAADVSRAFAGLLRLVAERIGDCIVRHVHRGTLAQHAERLPDSDIKVLLIDDEPVMRAHVGSHLRRRGFDFYGAERAQEGLDMAVSVQPDVILVDRKLPDMDGIEVLRTVRRNDRLSTVPCIMLSGFSDEAARIQALKEGADDFVAKPFSTRELVERIRTNVRMAQARRAAVWRESELLRLRQSQQELRTLLDTIQNVRADERRFLAREVHDQLGQLLTAAKIDIRLLEKRALEGRALLEAGQVANGLRSARASLDEAISSVQNISILLRPPALENGGLIAALRWQAEDCERRARLECRVKHDPAGYVEPSRFVAGEMFRIVQEALTNVMRHAKATCVLVHVAVRGGNLVLRICDNGVGIPRNVATSPVAIGIAGIRERAASIRASLQVHGRPGRGTIIAVRRGLTLP